MLIEYAPLIRIEPLRVGESSVALFPGDNAAHVQDGRKRGSSGFKKIAYLLQGHDPNPCDEVNSKYSTRRRSWLQLSSQSSHSSAR